MLFIIRFRIWDHLLLSPPLRHLLVAECQRIAVSWATAGLLLSGLLLAEPNGILTRKRTEVFPLDLNEPLICGSLDQIKERVSFYTCPYAIFRRIITLWEKSMLTFQCEYRRNDKRYLIFLISLIIKNYQVGHKLLKYYIDDQLNMFFTWLHELIIIYLI